MTDELSNLVERLNDPLLSDLDVITWGAPVPSFGNLTLSKIATLGLNPSNKEFVDNNGDELNGNERRFHTLNSLGISRWSETEPEHLQAMIELCQDYFFRNPYDGWFKRLDYIISGTAMSYYFPSSQACHLDLIPYATSCKWTDLTPKQRTTLLEITGDTLGMLLNNSPVKLLILNGRTVVDCLRKICDVAFDEIYMNEWTLPRKDGNGIAGYAYKGVISKIGGVCLNQPILAIGYNHNIQSSYGVTSQVQTAIRNWVSATAKEVLQ